MRVVESTKADDNTVLDTHLLQQYAGVLLAQAGLHFGSHNMADLATGIRSTMQAVGVSSPQRLLALVAQQQPDTKPFFEALVRSVTIGETYFMRYPEQFAVLRDDILPALIAERRKANDLYLRVWSAGCSTGEEPYSLALTLRDLLPDFAAWNITILGTDINRNSLARAESGEFGAWSFRGVSDDLKQRHFMAAPDGKSWRVLPELRKVVKFSYLNLGDDCYPALMTQTTAMDLILCRNVLIYFSEKSASHVVGRLFTSLADGGSLLVGPVEPNDTMFRDFQSRFTGGTMVYRRPRVDGSGDEPVAPPVARRRPAPVAAPVPAASPALPQMKLAFVPRNRAVHVLEDPGSLIQLAQSAWRDGHHERAKQHADRALAREPNNGEAHLLLALIAADRGHFEDAAAHAARSINAIPLDVRAHHLAAIVASERGEASVAIEHLKKCVFLDRHFVLGHFGLAVALRQQGAKAECSRYLKNTLALLESEKDDATLPGVEDIAAGWVKKVARKYLQELSEKN